MRLSVIAVSLALATSIVAADKANAAIRRATSIPPQALRPALKALSEARDLQFIYRTDLVGDRRTAGASGELTADEALRQLLAGTNLTYQYLDDKTITITETASAPREADRPAVSARAPASSAPETVTSTPSAAKDGQREPSFWSRFRLAQVDSRAAVSDTESSTGSKESASNAKIEEIVVTAQKRAESIRDVPLSISAITADEIDRRRMVNAGDYLRGVPGANQVDSANGASIVIRGVETSPQIQNFGSGPTTATYFGETPTTSTAGLSAGTNIDVKLVDIQRVEVLRGPQGTAFGNSSMGGAVRTIPMPPNLERLEGKVAASFSTTSGSGGENYDVTAVANIPLITDRLAIRVVGYEYNDAGFYRNRAGSNAAFQTNVVIPSGAQAFAHDANEVGEHEARGGRISALFQASSKLRFTASFLTQKSWTDGMPVSSSGTYDQLMLDVDPQHVVRGRRDGVSDSDLDIANLTAEYDFSWASLLATYSHTESSTLLSQPFQLYGQGWPMSFFAPSEHRENVGEVRIVTRLDGPWNFLAGLYAEKLDDRTDNDFRWFGDPAGNFFDPGNPFVGHALDQRELEQKAAFGEASWKILPALTVTAGARAYRYERSVTSTTTGGLFTDTFSDTSADASGSTFRGNVSYKPNENALVYAGWSEGFRLGKPQAGVPIGRCDLNGDGLVDGTNITIDSTRSVSSDDVESFELGGKFAMLDGRLTIDTAVFRLDWSDIPVTTHAGTQPVSCGLTYVTNAGAAKSEGVELQLRYLFGNGLRLDAGGSHIRAKLTEDAPDQGFSKGDRLPGSPKTSANLGLQYDFAMGEYPLSVRADSVYVGSFFGDILATQNLKSGGYVKVDASARLTVNRMSIDLFVRNLTNEDKFVFRDTTPAVGEYFGYRLQPRTVGVQVGYAF